MKTEREFVNTELTTAIVIAQKAHEGQFRRDGTTPYIQHPIAVANIASVRYATQFYGRQDTGFFYKAASVAHLHDALEDSTETEESLRAAGISEEVIIAVKALTKLEGETYREALVRAKANELARFVKVCDMMANLLDSPTPRQIEKYTDGLKFLLT